jgi:hypothetical protein
MRGLKPNPCGAIARISLNGTQKIVKGARRFIRRLTASSSSFQANSGKVDGNSSLAGKKLKIDNLVKRVSALERRDHLKWQKGA